MHFCFGLKRAFEFITIQRNKFRAITFNPSVIKLDNVITCTVVTFTFTGLAFNIEVEDEVAVTGKFQEL